MNLKKTKFYLLTSIMALTSCSEDLNEVESINKKSKLQTEITNKVPSNFKTSNFYKAPIKATKITFTGKSSNDLNKLINKNSNKNGTGVIIQIPKGTYDWTKINLKSNIHLEIAKGTIIKASSTAPLFNFGTSKVGARIKNASIYGKKGNRFTIDISNPNYTNKNLAVVKIGRVNNFRVANINIKDRRSSVNSIVLSHIVGAAENRPGPIDGVIENIRQTGAHTGYGLVQTYNAKHILFKNLSCDGGVTLRMETDDKGMKNELKNGNKKGGVARIFAYNIKNTNGLTALMFSPHFVKNGKIIANRITSIGSAFAVRVEKGFLELFDKNNQFPITNAGKKDFKTFIENQFNINGTALSGNPYKRNNGKQWAVRLSGAAADASRNSYVKDQLGNNLIAGSFITSNVNNITATYKSGKAAKVKQLHLKYIPCNNWKDIRNPDTSLGMFNGFEYHAPSVSLCYDNTIESSNGGNYEVKIGGFLNFKNFPNGFTKVIKPNTPAACNNNPNTITKYSANFPN